MTNDELECSGEVLVGEGDCWACLRGVGSDWVIGSDCVVGSDWVVGGRGLIVGCGYIVRPDLWRAGLTLLFVLLRVVLLLVFCSMLFCCAMLCCMVCCCLSEWFQHPDGAGEVA